MTGKMAAGICAVVAVVAIGGELGYLHYERNKPMKLPQKAERGPTNPDYLVFLKQKRPSTPADVKELTGQTLWVSAGGQMDYYPSDGHHADYSKTAGTLLGAEPLIVKGVFEQKAPKNSIMAAYRIPAGDVQVLLAFTKPKSDDPKKEYAVPVGYREGKDYEFKMDEIFFYDDPHELYKHWSPQAWQAIEEHKVILGMSERQVQLALGQVSKSVSEEEGNRLVVYSNLGHPMAVTFVNDHATAFRADQGF
jgi:hypothetical protein